MPQKLEWKVVTLVQLLNFTSELQDGHTHIHTHMHIHTPISRTNNFKKLASLAAGQYVSILKV